MYSRWIGILLFVVSYFVFAYGHVPGTKIKSPAMAIIGATLMLVLGVVSPAAAVRSIDFSTLVLLFAMMIIIASLHLAGIFDRLACTSCAGSPHDIFCQP